MWGSAAEVDCWALRACGLPAREPRAAHASVHPARPLPPASRRCAQVPINRDDFDTALRALATEADPIVSVNRHMITVK